MKQCMKQWLLNSSVNGCCRLTVRSWDGMVLWTQIRARGRVRQTSTSGIYHRINTLKIYSSLHLVLSTQVYYNCEQQCLIQPPQMLFFDDVNALKVRFAES